MQSYARQCQQDTSCIGAISSSAAGTNRRPAGLSKHPVRTKKHTHLGCTHSTRSIHKPASKQAAATTPHSTQCISTALRLLRLSTICNSICQRWAVGGGKDQHHPYAPSSACGSPHCLLVQRAQLTTSSDRCRCLGMHCTVQLAPYSTAGVLNPAAACSQLTNTAHQHDARHAVPDSCTASLMQQRCPMS